MKELWPTKYVSISPIRIMQIKMFKNQEELKFKTTKTYSNFAGENLNLISLLLCFFPRINFLENYEVNTQVDFFFNYGIV